MRVKILDVPPEKRGWRGCLLQVGQELNLAPQAGQVLIDRGAAREMTFAMAEAAVSEERSTAVVDTPKPKKVTRGSTTYKQPKKNG